MDTLLWRERERERERDRDREGEREREIGGREWNGGKGEIIRVKF